MIIPWPNPMFFGSRIFYRRNQTHWNPSKSEQFGVEDGPSSGTPLNTLKMAWHRKTAEWPQDELDHACVAGWFVQTLSCLRAVQFLKCFWSFDTPLISYHNFSYQNMCYYLLTHCCCFRWLRPPKKWNMEPERLILSWMTFPLHIKQLFIEG